MLKAVPLLAFVVIGYIIIALLTGSAMGSGLMSLNLPSGATWVLTIGDLLLLVGAFLLYLEIVKATRSRRAGADHALSMALFVVALLAFLLVAGCGTSVFLIITVFTLIDVIAGFTISLSTARRDISIN